MAIQDISNLAISASFQNILQRSGSVIGTATGTQVDSLTITASLATTAEVATSSSYSDTALSASHAVQADSTLSANTATSASHALNADNAISSSHALNADDAISSSYAATASVALNVIDQVDTGSLLTTASISDATITFTKGDASTFAITANNVVSASYAATASVLLGSVESASYALSASYAISSSRAVTAAHSDTTQEVVINVKNTSGGIIAKGTPVYATGVTGENINVEPADYSSASTMPAIAVTQEQISTNATGEATVTGRIIGVNTLGFTAGRNIYVNGSGTFTDTRPTGSGVLVQNIGVVGKVNETDGEIVIQGSGRTNDLPNIATGGVWVGNTSGVAAVVQTGSLSVATASLAQGLATGIDININSITASSATFQTASVGLLQSVTGSAKIIGDAFIVVNNDTPAERYAGLSVYDSGSARNTSSFAYDGLTDDWFFEKDVTGSAHFGVALFGPEYATKGSPTYITANRVPKGVGDHHLEDSNISDNGSTIVLGSDTQITGSLGVTGAITGTITSATSASHALNADNAISASHAVQADSALSATSATTAISASHAVQADSALTANTATSASHAIIADSALTATSATTAVSASHAVQADSALAADTATSSSHALNADDAISSSYATSASIADYQKNLNSNSGSIQLWQGSKTAYDAISGSASNDVLYFVIE